MDPATTSGLVLAVIPLIISAFENYEYTFQPILIFFYERRCQKEVERCQSRLKIQHANFRNECFLLLLHLKVKFSPSLELDAKAFRQSVNQDHGLETRIKNRLDNSYDACLSALRLINDLLGEVFEETEQLYLSTEKDRFNDKFQEIGDRISDLHQIRKQLRSIDSFQTHFDNTLDSNVKHYHAARLASAKLHNVIVRRWQCDNPEVHLANICLDNAIEDSLQANQDIHFDVAWTCPAQRRRSEQVAKPIMLLVDNPVDLQAASLSDPETIAVDLRQRLEMALEIPLGASENSSLHVGHAATTSPGRDLGVISDNREIPVNLCDVPRLCNLLAKQQSSAMVGFLEDESHVKHVIHFVGGQKPSSSTMITLADHLKAAQDKDVGIPEVELAKVLATAVLRFHSTPWLQNQWKSQDVVFFGGGESLGLPYLKSSVTMRKSVLSMTPQTAPVTDVIGADAREATSRTLYCLGVILLELVYKARLEDLRTESDASGGDATTLHQTALRLSGRVWKEMGPDYAHAVSMCLHQGFGDSATMDDLIVQRAFFDQVVQKLAKSAKGLREF